MDELQAEIDAFEQMRAKLEDEHMDQWVLFHGRSLVRVHPSFEAAADDGVRQFGRGPFLIRQVGAPPMTLPTSVVYHRPNAER